MRRDENGVAVPPTEFPLPWTIDDDGVVVCSNGRDINGDAVLEFTVHAANYHAQMAEILRRLAEWHEQETDDIGVIVADAVSLWDEMRKDGE